MSRLTIKRPAGVRADVHAAIVVVAVRAVVAAAAEGRAPAIDGLGSLDRRHVRALDLVRAPGTSRPAAESVLAASVGRRLAGIPGPTSTEELLEARAAIREQRGQASTRDVVAAEERAMSLARADLLAVRSVVSTLEHQLLTRRQPRLRMEPETLRAIIKHRAGVRHERAVMP